MTESRSDPPVFSFDAAIARLRDGETLDEVAASCGFSPPRLRLRLVTGFGGAVVDDAERSGRVSRYYNDHGAEAVRLYESGTSVVAIARGHGTDRTVVQAALDRAGSPVKSRPSIPGEGRRIGATISEADLLSGLRAAAAENGGAIGPVDYRSWYQAQPKPNRYGSHDTIMLRFGGFDLALEAAGLPPHPTTHYNRRRDAYSDGDLRDVFARFVAWADEHQLRGSTGDYDTWRANHEMGAPTRNVVRRPFIAEGLTWPNAVEQVRREV